LKKGNGQEPKRHPKQWRATSWATWPETGRAGQFVAFGGRPNGGENRIKPKPVKTIIISEMSQKHTDQTHGEYPSSFQ